MDLNYLNQLINEDDFEDIFKDFDFSLLDGLDFKEDAVREEIIYPILKELGYTGSSENKIIRSKALKHPFYYFGTKQYNVNIIPDYTFVLDNKNYWILDAKRPSEEIQTGKNVFQAYSYAMHPEIQCEIYGLCNGREFVLFNTRQHTPVLSFKVKNLKNNWKELKKHLLPEFVKKPHLKDFSPDLGLFIMKIGFIELLIEPLTFEVKDINDIAKLDVNTYTINDVFGINGLDNTKFMGTFDFGEDQYNQLLSILPNNVKEAITRSLAKQPFRFQSVNSIKTPLKIIAKVGQKIHSNNDESYLPFQVIKFEELNNSST